MADIYKYDKLGRVIPGKTKYIKKKEKKVEYIKKKEKKYITKKKEPSNFQKKKVAQWEDIMSTVKKGGIGSDRVTSRYKSPSQAFEYFADKPGSKYEGLATKKLHKLRSATERKKVNYKQ